MAGRSVRSSVVLGSIVLENRLLDFQQPCMLIKGSPCNFGNTSHAKGNFAVLYIGVTSRCNVVWIV